MIGRPLIAQDPSRFGIQALPERKSETRFAYAGLAGQQHDLTFTSSGPLETRKQKADFVLATNEWGELMPVKRRPSVCRSPTTRQARIGALKPFRSRVPRSLTSNNPPSNRCVDSATTTAPASAHA